MEFLGKNLKGEVLGKIIYNSSFDVMRKKPITSYINDVKLKKMTPLFSTKETVERALALEPGDRRSGLAAMTSFNFSLVTCKVRIFQPI